MARGSRVAGGLRARRTADGATGNGGGRLTGAGHGASDEQTDEARAARDEYERGRRGRVTSTSGSMRFELFEAMARRFWHQIPAEYREGVEGVEVERRAVAHPKLRDIYTMGECLTESYPSGYEGPETLRSRLVLYYGSFQQLSRLDPDFDWESEIWETLTHELRHHLESLAAEDALEDRDYAADENFKRQDGAPYDPLFFRAGEEVEPGVYMVEDDVFIERELRTRELPAAFDFSFGRAPYRVRVPPAAVGSADVWLIRLTEGVTVPGEAYLAVTRRPGLVESVRGLFSGRRARVREAEAAAERL